MKKIEDKLGNMELESLQIANVFLSGRYHCQDIAKYRSSANKDLAYALHISDAAAHHYATYFKNQTNKGKQLARDDAPRSRKEFNKRRNIINRYHMQVMRTLFANKESLTFITKRPFVCSGVSSTTAIAGCIREALPILAKHAYGDKGSVESIMLLPIIDWLTEMAWGITRVTRYKETLPVDKFLFEKGRQFISHNYPAKKDIEFAQTTKPIPVSVPQPVKDILKNMLPELTDKLPDDFELKLAKGDFLCLGQTIYRAKKDLHLYRSSNNGIVKRDDNQSMSIEDIELA
ncbi:hypothetical protein [Vibrio phage BONAISHI]|nr:hypothetical protein [Vibrio phage BONAISHI]